MPNKVSKQKMQNINKDIKKTLTDHCKQLKDVRQENRGAGYKTQSIPHETGYSNFLSVFSRIATASV